MAWGARRCFVMLEPYGDGFTVPVNVAISTHQLYGERARWGNGCQPDLVCGEVK
jgi:hypothetical protein